MNHTTATKVRNLTVLNVRALAGLPAELGIRTSTASAVIPGAPAAAMDLLGRARRALAEADRPYESLDAIIRKLSEAVTAGADTRHVSTIEVDSTAAVAQDVPNPAAETRCPRGVSGEQRRKFLSLTEAQRRVYRHHFDVSGRPAAICYQVATGQVDFSNPADPQPPAVEAAEPTCPHGRTFPHFMTAQATGGGTISLGLCAPTPADSPEPSVLPADARP